MSSYKSFTLTFICMIFISSYSVLGCESCQPVIVNVTPIIIIEPPAIISPVIVEPQVIVPPVIVESPVIVPPVTVNPPVIFPPIVVPPVVVPPVTIPPATSQLNTSTPCPPPPAQQPLPMTPKAPNCPVGVMKLDACVDLLGGLVQVAFGDAVANKCCPLLEGLLELEAALCLCSALKVKLLNLDIYLPIAHKLLVSCGKAPPQGFNCTV